ncbi:GlxA family transcriptional regulator [Alteromonas sp. CYL-A6]|uniref:GlxA family transcriptional regulator n=1 Tax=Alteromonas nitratireducens TaxID=3390813 RepID=UPI0034B0C709
MQRNTPDLSVTIVAFDQALASAITGAHDLFALAGITWQRIHNQPIKPAFQVRLASLHAAPVTCTNQFILQPQTALEDIDKTDILIVPTIGGDIPRVLQNNQNLQVHLRRLYHSGADIAGNCTGTFLLAAAGLLANRAATTHWGYAEQFRQLFPDVRLQPEKMLTEHDNVFCAGGGMAWIDLALLLIERYCGYQVASDTAKSHVLDMSRPNQTMYAGTRQHKFHQDHAILAIQDTLDKQFRSAVSLQSLAHQHNMTPRTLTRRFQRATGLTPIKYLQTVRIERAMKLLETPHNALEKIVTEIGYDDVSSFSRLFKRHTGLSPSQYRAKFKRN